MSEQVYLVEWLGVTAYIRAVSKDKAKMRAMREHCIGTVCAQDLDPDAQDRMEKCLRALPIPEET